MKLKHIQVLEERRKEQFYVDTLFGDSEIKVSTDVVNQMKARIVETIPSGVTYFCEYTKDYVQRKYNMQSHGALLAIKKSQVHNVLLMKYS
jgi:hypothetical protein